VSAFVIVDDRSVAVVDDVAQVAIRDEARRRHLRHVALVRVCVHFVHKWAMLAHSSTCYVDARTTHSDQRCAGDETARALDCARARTGAVLCARDVLCVCA
jgi:hypothetical protein